MARRYVRDAKGRFAPKGYSGQTGGRGARLKSGKGNIREVGGQKRGERHVLRSAETRAASKRSFDAAVKSGNVTLPKSLGGQGMPRNSFPAQAAARKKAQAQAERDAALRKSGLPKSGGAMRVKGGIKRDPKAGEKLKQLQQKNKPQSAKATRLGGRLNPASKADRAATKKVEQAMSRERAARSTAMRTQGPFSGPARQKANQNLENATRETASAIQTRRNIRAQFPVQTKTPTTSGPRIGSTISKPRSTTSQRQRAQSNLTRAEDRRSFTGQNRIKSKRIARQALEFYENPSRALRNRKPGLGFRMPRTFRR